MGMEEAMTEKKKNNGKTPGIISDNLFFVQIGHGYLLAPVFYSFTVLGVAVTCSVDANRKTVKKTMFI